MAFLEDMRVAQEGVLSLGFWALQVYRFGHLRYRFHSRLVRYPLGVFHLVLAKLAEMLCGVTIGVVAKIGRRLVIEHSGGIVVHGNGVIGTTVSSAKASPSATGAWTGRWRRRISATV